MRALIGSLMLAALTVPAAAQSLAARVAAAPTGPVRLTFQARDGVCAGGDGWQRIDRRGPRDDGWQPDCPRTTVHVMLQREGGRVTRLRAHAGGRWTAASPGTDLGRVAAPEAAAYLLDVATQSEGVAESAIGAAALADSATIWPALVTLARRTSLPRGARKAALFWLGQEAGAKVSAELASVAEDASTDTEVAEAAVFALSRQPAGEGVPAMIRVARTHKSPKVRRTALFWLGQSEDPRAIALFEELLTTR